MTEQLRNLPSVDEVLRCQQLADLRALHPHRRLAQWARDAVDHFRNQILDGVPIDSAAALQIVLDRVRQTQQGDEGQSIQQVINATGIVLHTNLGRAPLARRASERVSKATQYTNVELNLQSGRRSKRGERVSALLAQLGRQRRRTGRQ